MHYQLNSKLVLIYNDTSYSYHLTTIITNHTQAQDRLFYSSQGNPFQLHEDNSICYTHLRISLVGNSSIHQTCYFTIRHQFIESLILQSDSITEYIISGWPNHPHARIAGSSGFMLHSTLTPLQTKSLHLHSIPSPFTSIHCIPLHFALHFPPLSPSSQHHSTYHTFSLSTLPNPHSLSFLVNFTLLLPFQLLTPVLPSQTSLQHYHMTIRHGCT